MTSLAPCKCVWAENAVCFLRFQATLSLCFRSAGVLVAAVPAGSRARCSASRRMKRRGCLSSPFCQESWAETSVDTG